MIVLVTGAKGFIGKNLVEQLKYKNIGNILEFGKDDDMQRLDQHCMECDFIFHLAGVNRPDRQEEFHEGNYSLTAHMLGFLKKHHNHCPIMLASSIQAELDNPYGKSKKESEALLKAYGEENGVKVLIYRFPNVFGKWCRPNYNSVVATFCHNIARNLPIQINGRDTSFQLVYIDDLIAGLIRALDGQEDKTEDGFLHVGPMYKVTLGEIADLLESFRDSRKTLQVPDMTEGSFSKKLYSTYLSYLPQNEFSYPLRMNIDDRGSFTEILRTADRGQFSVNLSKPGIEKGNHWHNTKNEKFLVVSGKALIQFRLPGSEEILAYHVSGEKLEIVDIPVGYTHNIINEGATDLITFIWCNECFNPNEPDTYSLNVNQ